MTEVKIGFDGIVIANAKSAPEMELTRQQIWLALAKDVLRDGEWVANPHRTWSDIDPSLPNAAIRVLGPPPTSGTRDAFAELALEGGCETFADIAVLKESDKKLYKRGVPLGARGWRLCRGRRERQSDRAEARGRPGGAGRVRLQLRLDQNADRIRGNLVDGVEPTFDNIASGDYPVSRSMYFYIKNAHVGKVPGIHEYVAEFTSERAFGDEGYLIDKGLIPMPATDRAMVRDAAKSLTPLSM